MEVGHWENVYRTKRADSVSWFRPKLDQSLALLDACALPEGARVVDAGGGASTLVDDVLERGLAPTVIDLSDTAMAVSRARLGERANDVEWIAGDASSALVPPASVDFWHDRAVCHFLDDSTRSAYAAQVDQAVRPGGYALIATFAPDGPERCSGLPVHRYTPDEIASVMGDGFETVAVARELHRTPAGGNQAFAYALLRRR